MLEHRLRQSLPSTLRLERELTGGGMARVFLAEDETLGRKVVIKVLAPELGELMSSERFKREVHVAAQLQHPHLVPVLQAGEADGIPYFIMPYVEGESLRVRLGDGQALPMREAVAILRDVARAMAYAHERGIVHRDIKPDNVLLSSGSAMVTDFGIAKALSSSRTGPTDNDTALTRAGSSLGTPTYMAPEQVAADPHADHRVDVYAFGIMAYEMFTGKPPFHGRAPQALLTAHLTETPAPLSSQLPAVPRGLHDLVMQCLEKDSARRPATAREVVERLEDLDWSGERAVAPARRARGRVALVAAAVALALIVGGWLWSRRAPPPAINAQLVTVVPFRIASADPHLHYLREGMLDLLAAKLPGEGGLQATEPRALLTAWRSAGGGEHHDLSPDEAHRLTHQLGAGWLLLGDVVGTPSRVVLNASLFPVGVTEPRTKVSVEGPPDSLGGLVDELVRRLLTSASEGVQPGTSLTNTSLPTLRLYLEGVASLRRGLPGSVQAFSAAVDSDSTFAPAALGLVQATGWFNDGGQSARGLRLAWAGKEQLNAKDQALLIATAGPNYPETPSSRELFDASQRYLQLAPDRADAWYTYGDKIYHFGNALGFPDRAVRSADAFRRALAMDSSYVPGYIHLQQLAAELEDTLLDRRLERLRSAADTTSHWQLPVTWYRASARRDTVTMRRVWDRVQDNRSGMLFLVQRMPLFVPTASIEFSLEAVDSLIAHSVTPGQIRSNRVLDAAMLLTAGRPQASRAMLESTLGGLDDVSLHLRTLVDAAVGEGDTTGVPRALERLVPLAMAPTARDTVKAATQRSASRAVLAWRLNRGDTTGARVMLGHLQAGVEAAPRSRNPSLDRISALAFEAMLADRLGRADAASRAEQLDSLLDNANYAEFNAGRLAYVSMIAARLLEKHRSPAAALRAVRRRSSWWTNEMPYLATQLREQGRLAALAGADDEAILAYRHYVDLRAAAEPAQVAEREQVEKELARLESKRRE